MQDICLRHLKTKQVSKEEPILIESHILIHFMELFMCCFNVSKQWSFYQNIWCHMILMLLLFYVYNH